MSLGKGLHELESYSAAGEVVKRIAAVLPLRVQDRNRLWQTAVGEMMVANYHVYALGGGIADLVYGLDSAVQGDDEAETVLCRPVHTLERHAVTLVIAVRDIEIHGVGEALEEGIHQRDGSRTVNVIVAIYENMLTFGYGLVEPVHRLGHILHQEGVVEGGKRRTEEGARFLESAYSPLYQQCGQDGVYAQLSRQTGYGLRVHLGSGHPDLLFLQFIVCGHQDKDTHYISK